MTHELSDGSMTGSQPDPVADARPGADRAIPRGPGGHPTTGPTCCRACREGRGDTVGNSRRWALTDKALAVLEADSRFVSVPVLSRVGLQRIAEQNRTAL